MPQDDETMVTNSQTDLRLHPRIATPTQLRAMIHAAPRFIAVTNATGGGETAFLDALIPLLREDSLRVFRVEKDESGQVSMNHLLGRILEVQDGRGAVVKEEDAARACEILMFPETDEAGTIVAVNDAHTIDHAALRLLNIVSAGGPQDLHPVKVILVGKPGLSEVIQQTLPGGAVETVIMAPPAPEGVDAGDPVPPEPAAAASVPPPPPPTRASQSTNETAAVQAAGLDVPPDDCGPDLVAALRTASTDAGMQETPTAVRLSALRTRQPARQIWVLAVGILVVVGATTVGALAFWYRDLAAVPDRLQPEPAPPNAAVAVGAGLSAAVPATVVTAANPSPVRAAVVSGPAPLPVAPPAAEPVSPGPGTVPVPAPAPRPAADSHAQNRVSPDVVQTLLTRADALLGGGDVFAARALYKRAVDAGSAIAATGVGKTFDPGFLVRLGVVGLRSDAAVAASWYRRAIELGDATAQPLLDRLEHPLP